MTSPTIRPTISQLVGWDVPQLRAGVGRLGQVADRLVPWRARLDTLGRQLGTAECWSGPAGSVAAAALVELSTATSRLSGVLDSSLSSLAGLSSAADEAQAWAVGAMAAAAEAGAGWDAAGQLVGLPPPPTPVMGADQAAAVAAARSAGRSATARADEAWAAAARALGCAREAQQPLAGVRGAAQGPLGSGDLVVHLGAGTVAAGPPPAAGTDPRTVAAWWAGLTSAEQLAVVAQEPGAVGALDGLPGWARDRANRGDLAAALAHLPPGSVGHRMARSVASTLSGAEATGGVVQLLQFDPAADLVAIAVGDVDTAAAVGVLVPGIETTPTEDLAGLVGDARDVAAAAAAAAPGLAVATVAWLGYRTPGWQTSFLPSAARDGGRALDRALDGLAAARTGPGGAPPRGRAAPPRTTVVAHSYGTVVAGRAVRAPGRLAADALVLLGSPGLVAGDADDLEAEEVYGAWSPGDPVSWLQWFGDTPADPSFGDVPLPVEPTQWHTQYYDPDRPTLAAIGEVVAGVREGG